MHLAIIGGTGKQGTALATRFARAGVPVILGSREAGRGAAAAQALSEQTGLPHIHGDSNRAAAAAAVPAT